MLSAACKETQYLPFCSKGPPSHPGSNPRCQPLPQPHNTHYMLYYHHTFSTWLPPWLAKADSGSYWSFAIVYISIVRRKQAEKALAPSAFFSGLWLRE